MKDYQRYPSAAARRLLRLSEVKYQVGLGRSAIYEQIKLGKFPAPVNIGPRAVAWPSDQIDAWIDSRIQFKSNDAVARRQS
jgi:prophage regulatory protein